MNNDMPSRFDMIEIIFDLLCKQLFQEDPSTSLEDAMYLFRIPEGCTRAKLFEIEGVWKRLLSRELTTTKGIEEEQQLNVSQGQYME